MVASVLPSRGINFEFERLWISLGYGSFTNHLVDKIGLPRGSLPAIGPFAGPADLTDERDEGPPGEVVGLLEGKQNRIGYGCARLHAAAMLSVTSFA